MYAVLMESSSYDFESWYYFIKCEGNEENLKFMCDQFKTIKECTMFDEDITMFDMDLEHLVSEQTAKEMCLLDLNSISYHRKFDGVLKKIDFAFKKKDNDEKRMIRICKIIGDGKIDDFIDLEDIHESHAGDNSESDSDIASGIDESDVENMIQDMDDTSISRDKMPSNISNIQNNKNKRKK